MHKHLLTSISNGLGHITLNSERTLNSLHQEMAEELFSILTKWETDESVLAIFLDGAGTRAFCAGGDIKNLYHALIKDQLGKINQTCLTFFITEYTLDYKIHTYSKPIITWNSGITMGGGMGLMNGASHRIVTETSLLAMPEVSIGLYPDVGATYFFNKLPPGVGKFLGVTGARINAGDALNLELADFFLASHDKEKLLTNLKKITWSSDRLTNDHLIKTTLSSLSSKDLPPANTQSYLTHFEKLHSISNIKKFIEIIQDFPQNEWLLHSLAILKKGSPTSAAIILKQMEQGQNLGLKDAFKTELNLSVHCSLFPDFTEGVRALLIDKDQNPQWRPATIDELTPDYIEKFFTPLWSEKEHPFNNW